VALTVAQLVARVTADTSGFYKSMAIMNSSLVRTGSVASRALAGIGLATVGVGILSLRAAANFQQSMNLLEAVSGSTQGQMASLRNEAIALGKDFKLPNVSAKDAADSMVELSKAGLTTKQILGATRGALQLGLAANIGFADSAQLTARSLKAFDLDGNQAVRVANLFAAGANKSTAEISDLALGVQNAGAQFHGAGLSIEDLIASLSIMADNALSGEYAGTALKTMLIRLTSPTDKAKSVMDKYGISIFNARGEMKAMPNIIGQFQQHLGKLTQEQREQALTTIFGVRANQAMRILMNEGSDAYVKYRKEVTGTNAAQAIAEARTRGFNGALGALGSAVETLAIQLGTKMLPAAEQLVRALANVIAAIDPDKVAAIFRPFADAVEWFSNLVKHSTILQAALVGIAAALGGMLVISMVTGLVGALTAAVVGLTAAMLANPVGLVAAALIGLGAALYYAYQHSETFRNAVNNAFTFLKSLIPIVTEFGRSVIATFQNIWNLVGPLVTGFVNTVRDRFMVMVNFIRDNMDRILTILRAEWTIISTVIKTFVENILSVFRIFSAALRGDWGEVWDQLKAIVSRTLSAVVTIIRSAVTIIFNAAILLGKAIWEGIKQGAAELAAQVRQVLSRAVDVIKQIPALAYAAALAIGKGIVDGVLAGIGDIGSAVYDKLAGGIRGAINKAKGLFGIFSPSKVTSDELGKPLGQGVTEGMLLGLVDLPTKMSDKIREAVTAAQHTIEGQTQTLSSAWDRMVGDALAAFDAQTAQFKTKAEKMLEAFDVSQKVAENKKKIQELVDSVKAAKAELAAFQATPQETLTQNEGEADAAFAQRKLEAQQKWQDQYNQLTTQFEDAQTALQEEKAAQRLQKKRDALVASADESRKQYDAARALQRRHLEDTLQDYIDNLKQYPQKQKFYQDKTIALLDSYGVNYFNAGKAVGRAFAAGLLQAQEEVARAARALAGSVENFLATHSPAKEGPLSTLDTWWDSFGKTLVSGLDTSYVSRAAASLAGSMGVLSPSTSNLTSANLTGASQAGAGVTYNNYYLKVEGSLIKEQDLADHLYSLVSQQASRGKTLLG